MSVSDLPAINAGLNSLSTLFILLGWYSILKEYKRRHIACMVSAIITSSLFLVLYVLHKILVQGVHTPFAGEGGIRIVYYAILITHLILAMAVLPLVILTVVPALRARYDRHKRIAKWTLPVWLYVSVTGVVIYFMLYVWYPVQ